MLNKTQKEVLEGSWGFEGDILSSILSNNNVPNDIKVVYLLKAISEDCETFNRSLDLLFAPVEAQNQDYIDFLVALKRTNDICFNHDFLNGEFGLKKTQDLFLGNLGPFDSKEVKTEIQTLVHAGIQGFCQNLTLEEKHQLIYSHLIFK